MKSFLEWFKAGTKVKRWIFLIVVGITLTCYAFMQVLTRDSVIVKDVVKIIIEFALGFLFIIIGIIFIQKRNLEILIEANDGDSEKGKKAKVNIKSLIFNRKVYDEGPKIVVIGGGEGLNMVIRGLKKYTNNITAIVTMSEYGEFPSNSRQILDTLPLNDIKGSISALSDQEVLMSKLMNFNFKDDTLKGLNFGDIYMLAMSEIYDNISEAIRKSTKVLNITGQVLPVTLDEIKICAELADGTTIERKSKIVETVSEKIETINRVYISPSNCRPAPGVLEAIEDAEAIIIGPGSLYTNVLPNLLVKNVAKKIKETKTIKLYISNIMTEPGQTDNYSLSDHIKAIHSHVGRGIIDYCLADTSDLIPEYVRKYNMEGSDIVELDSTNVTAEGIKLIKRDLSSSRNGVIRHDADKVAKIIMELICNELRFRDLQNDTEYLLIDSVLKSQKKYLAKQAKKSNKAKRVIKNQEPRAKHREKRTSKFAEKYKDRVQSIQNSDAKTIENKKVAEKSNKIEEKIVSKKNAEKLNKMEEKNISKREKINPKKKVKSNKHINS
ncbi:MAG: uridine diphosphate-N-acetylglucosamine-binding protein YvcK [Clostridia bacterium]|nr:uridine diphosphate-N-acetylglucosamine-binding protein YvcK [Clostridia bacterium]